MHFQEIHQFYQGSQYFFNMRTAYSTQRLWGFLQGVLQVAMSQAFITMLPRKRGLRVADFSQFVSRYLEFLIFDQFNHLVD